MVLGSSVLVAGFWILGAGCFEREAGLGVGCQKNGFTFGGWGFGVGGVLGLGLVLGPVLVPAHGPMHGPVLGIALGLVRGHVQRG